MFKLKFGILPAHWGTAGKTRERMRAEYELTGFELKKRLLEIDEDMYSDREFKTKTFDLLFEFNKITKKEHRHLLVSLMEDGPQKQLALAELNYKEGIISESAYTKEVATIKNEPWVTVISMDFGSKNSLEGNFELDWNDPFVDKLKAEGYAGPTPDIIVNQWFMEVCRNIAMEEFDGAGDFTADSDANLDAVKRWSSDSKSFGEGRKGYQ